MTPRSTSVSLSHDLGHVPLPVPAMATLYPLAILLRPLPAPRLSSLALRALNLSGRGLPQHPTPRPTNFSVFHPLPSQPQAQPREVLSVGESHHSPQLACTSLQVQDLAPSASSSLDFWSVPLHWLLPASPNFLCEEHGHLPGHTRPKT